MRSLRRLSIAPSGASPGQELIADLNTDIGDVPETDILHFKF